MYTHIYVCVCVCASARVFLQDLIMLYNFKIYGGLCDDNNMRDELRMSLSIQHIYIIYLFAIVIEPVDVLFGSVTETNWNILSRG